MIALKFDQAGSSRSSEASTSPVGQCQVVIEIRPGIAWFDATLSLFSLLHVRPSQCNTDRSWKYRRNVLAFWKPFRSLNWCSQFKKSRPMVAFPFEISVGNTWSGGLDRLGTWVNPLI